MVCLIVAEASLFAVFVAQGARSLTVLLFARGGEGAHIETSACHVTRSDGVERQPEIVNGRKKGQNMTTELSEVGRGMGGDVDHSR